MWRSNPAVPRVRQLRGVQVPTFIYGTAWKEDATERLTLLALGHGFRGIDTANQRKHYHEAAVGAALAKAGFTVPLRRKEVFLQSKFTFRAAQDHRLPYDPSAAVASQVKESFASSLEHLGTDYLDSYLLHGPTRREGLTDEDFEAWRAMEDLQRAGKALLIGVSNVTAAQLEELHRGARVKPALVQNRCFARPQADRAVRAFCNANGMLYQGFSLLTAVRPLLMHPSMGALARKAGMTAEQAIFRFCLAQGMVTLSGTSSEQHMEDDMRVYDRALPPEDVDTILTLMGLTA
jgi:diketogulonate reductase-like aldo/keto reductase